MPTISEGRVPPVWLPRAYQKKLKTTPVPSFLKKNPWVFPALHKAKTILPSQSLRVDYARWLDQSFDYWVACHVKNLRPAAVIAYENSAYHTFKAAKAVGAQCILDAASIHRLSGAARSSVQQTPGLPETNRRLDVEVSFADHILTCSPLAAESYIKAGVSERKVHAIPLGASLPTSTEIANIRPRQQDRPVRFIFAGALSYRKSIDLILTAFLKLFQNGYSYEIIFVGGEAESGWVQQISKLPNAKYLPNCPQTALYQLFQNSDCLLLPSRFDSFGMVVAEAMACGTPAIVSTETGSKIIIEQHPNAGWVVEPTFEHVYLCVKRLIENRDILSSSRVFAIAAAADFTWDGYRERAGSLIERLIAK